VVRIHQVNFKPARLKDLVHRNPVNLGNHSNAANGYHLKSGQRKN
jgi:hypothetical protein